MEIFNRSIHLNRQTIKIYLCRFSFLFCAWEFSNLLLFGEEKTEYIKISMQLLKKHKRIEQTNKNMSIGEIE